MAAIYRIDRELKTIFSHASVELTDEDLYQHAADRLADPPSMPASTPSGTCRRSPPSCPQPARLLQGVPCFADAFSMDATNTSPRTELWVVAPRLRDWTEQLPRVRDVLCRHFSSRSEAGAPSLLQVTLFTTSAAAADVVHHAVQAFRANGPLGEVVSAACEAVLVAHGEGDELLSVSQLRAG